MYEDASSPLGVPLARDADGTLAYLAALLAADSDSLAAPVPDAAVPLLHALLRHALLREHAEAASRLLAGAGRIARGAARRRRAGRPRAGAVPDRDVDVAAHPAAAGRRPARARSATTWPRLDDFSAPEVRPLGELRSARWRASPPPTRPASNACSPPRSTPPPSGSTRG